MSNVFAKIYNKLVWWSCSWLTWRNWIIGRTKICWKMVRYLCTVPYLLVNLVFWVAPCLGAFLPLAGLDLVRSSFWVSVDRPWSLLSTHTHTLFDHIFSIICSVCCVFCRFRLWNVLVLKKGFWFGILCVCPVTKLKI